MATNNGTAIEMNNVEHDGNGQRQSTAAADVATTEGPRRSGERARLRDLLEENMSEEDRRTAAQWLYLVQKYGQETTMHGIRYVVEPSSLFCRRVLWLLIFAVACCLLTYLFAEKVEFLFSNPKNVNLDFNFNATLPFPAVTICNESPFRLTALQRNDLYDLMVIDHGMMEANRNQTYAATNATAGLGTFSGSNRAATGDRYSLYEDICSIPVQVPRQRRLVEVSRSVCREMCSTVYSDHCSGFLYDRKTRSCTLSPYTGNWQPTPSFNCSNANSSTPSAAQDAVDEPPRVEFYRRSRTLVTNTISCNFEERSPCSLVSDWTKIERWINTKSTSRKWDSTLAREGTGRYSAMVKSDVRPGFKARLMTPYMLTTNKCIELFYWIMATKPDNPLDQVETRISVIAINEDLEETVLFNSDRADFIDFQRMFVKLPTGVNRVAIEGRRDSRNVECALSLDDITIMDCDKFDAEKECLAHRLGRHYLGTMRKSASNKACLPWVEGPAQLSIHLPDASAVEASSYCRYIPGQKWKGPSCLVPSGSGYPTVERCNIPYCGALSVGCRNSQYVKCRNGICLPNSVQCDGIEYCTDGSTNELLCVGKESVTCKFEDEFACGYTVIPLGDMSWERTDSRTLSFEGSRGYIMIAKSFGKFGDQISLMSPLHKYEQSSVVKFRYYVAQEDPRTAGALAVQLLSIEKAPIKTLFAYGSNKFNSWTLATMCVPAGTYYLLFVARLGQPFVSDVMIDEVAVNKSMTRTTCDREDMQRGRDTLINCPLDGNLCGGVTLSTSRSLSTTWTFPLEDDRSARNLNNGGASGIEPDPNDVSGNRALSNETSVVARTNDYEDKDDATSKTSAVACGVLEHHSTEVQINSPKYPANYDNKLSCRYIIRSPPRSTITLTFQSFDVEDDENCAFDYLLIKCIEGPGTTKNFCGKARPPVMTFSCPKLLLHFRTDDMYTARGFSLSSKVKLQSPASSTGLFLDMKQTASGLGKWHKLAVYFPPVRPMLSCLTMTVTTSSYLAVKLAYAVNNTHNEILLFRSIQPLDDDVFRWQKTIDDGLTENKDFVVSIHTRSATVGTLAGVRHFQLLPNDCNSAGQLAKEYIHEFCNDDSECVGFRENSTERQRWFRTKQPDGKLALRCEFEGGFSQDTGTYIMSSIVNEDENPSGIFVFYKISSPDVRLLVTYEGQRTKRILRRRFLPLNVQISFDDDIDFDERYTIVFHAFRDTTSDSGNDAFVTITNVKLLRMRVQEDELVHVPNGFADRLGNQLTTPLVTITERGQMLHMKYVNEATDLQISVFMANQLGHINSRHIYKSTTLRISNDAQLQMCMPPGTYRIAFVMTSNSTTMPQRLIEITLTQQECQFESARILSDVRAETIPHFSTYSAKFAWNCRNALPQLFDGGGESGVFLAVKYDLKGVFRLDTLTSYRELIGYVVGTGLSTVRLKLENYQCGHVFITTVDETGEYKKNIISDQNELQMLANHEFESHNGIFQIRLESKSLKEKCVKSIYYEILLNNATTCNGTRVLIATDDIKTINNMPVADWESDVLYSGVEPKACLTMDLRLHNGIRSISVVLVYDNTSNSRSIMNRTLMQLSIDGWASGTDEELFKEIKDSFEFTLSGIQRYQIVVFFTTHPLSKDSVTAEIKSLTVRPGGCNSHDVPLRKTCGNDCGFTDTSTGDVRWLRYRHILVSHKPDESYNGTTSTTISGRRCQSWNSQSPHIHAYQHLGDQSNFCRNPDSDITLWCFTTDPGETSEYCVVPPSYTEDNSYIAVKFDGRLGKATLLSAPLIVKQPPLDSMCVSFSYVITSPSVVLKVAVVLLSTRPRWPPTFVKELTFRTRQADGGQCQLTINEPGVERVMFIADKVSFTKGSVDVFLWNISVAEGQCVADEESRGRRPTVYSGRRMHRRSYVSMIYNETKDLTMDNLTRTLGYNERDKFIIECKYGGEPCAEDALQPVLTEMGLCYTFNSDPSNTRISNISGVDFGLWLTINLEQYENVQGYADEAGVLVSLHNPGDVSVADRSMAVSPGVRALFDVKYSMTKSLPAPFGLCEESQKLRYFDGDQAFSVSKCHLECQADSLREFCGCREAYMPGNFSICNIEQYLTCVNRWKNSSAGRDYSNCHCPPSCENVAYDATVSSSHLSNLIVKSILGRPGSSSRGGNTDIHRRFLAAGEIRSRVDAEQMGTTIGRLEKLSVALDRLLSVLDVDVVNVETSVTGQLLEAVGALVQRTAMSISDFRQKIVDRFAAVYNRRAIFLVDQLINSANTFVTQVMRLWIAFIETSDQMSNAEFVSLVTDDSNPVASKALSAIVGHAATFCADARFLSEHVENLSLSADVRLCDAQEEDFCGLFMDDRNFEVLVENFTDEIRAQRDSFNDTDKNKEFGSFDKWINSNDDESDLHSTIHGLRQMVDTSYVARKVSCKTEFGKYLTDVFQWLDATSVINESLPLQPFDQTGAIALLNESITWLHTSTVAYTIGKITLNQLASEFTDRIDAINEIMSNISIDLVNAMDEEIRGTVTKYSDEIVEALIKLMILSKRFGDYSRESDPETYNDTDAFARALFVWRKPVPKFRHSSDVGYELSPLDSRRVWPLQQTMADFTRVASPRHVRLIIGEYFEQISLRSDQLQKDIRRQVQLANVALNDVKETMLEYNRSMIIKSDFVRNNFLKIKLFYGEIKYNSLEQSPAYDVKTLLSDLGGYLGLLIGGSALTLLEIIDLVFYNALLKLIGKR